MASQVRAKFCCDSHRMRTMFCRGGKWQRQWNMWISGAEKPVQGRANQFDLFHFDRFRFGVSFSGRIDQHRRRSLVSPSAVTSAISAPIGRLFHRSLFFFCPVGHYYCFHWGTDVSYLYTNAPCDLPETSFIVSVIVRNEIALNVTLEFSKKSWAFKNTRIECRLVSFESSSSGLATVKISLLQVEPFEFQQLLRKVRFSCSRNGHEKFKKFYAIMEHSDQLLLGLI